MTKVDEIQLAIRAKAGEQKAIVELYNQYLPMMHKTCRKYKSLNNLTYDDLLQYCTVYFMLAIEKFDPDKNNKFGTFLTGQLLQVYRDVVYQDMTVRRPSKNDSGTMETVQCMSVDAKVSDVLGGDSTDTFAEIYEDETARFWETSESDEEFAIINRIMQSELQSYAPFERTLIELCLYSNLAHHEISDALGAEVWKIRKLMQTFRANMRKRYAKVAS